MKRSPFLFLCVSLIAIGALAAFGPAEKTLGANVRLVYLHGVWVWTALIAFVVAALLGLVGFLTCCQAIHCWSRAVGRTGLIFWITYLPISMWAMQTNWNGLFLAEPRFRIAVVFALGGLLLQIGATLLEDPAWASAINIIYAAGLFIILSQTKEVMHPASPIFNSDAHRIQLFFISLLFLTLVVAWQVARLWHQVERPCVAVLQSANAPR